MKCLWPLVVLGGLLFPTNANGQDACIKARKVLDKLNSLHIQPRTVNDSLSEEIFSEFFRVLDREQQFFISKDTGSLVGYRKKLDDGNETVCAFLSASASLYRKKAEWYKNLVDSILAKPGDLSKNETGPTIVPGDVDIAKTNADLKSRILRDLKLKILFGIYRHAAADSTILTNINSFNKAEPNVRQRVKKNELVKIERLLKDGKSLREEVESCYLKAIPAVFDPHSTFFTKAEMDSYSESLNPSALSFGIKVEETPMGDVLVSQVVPGSPSWNSNQINKDDVLLGIQWRSSGVYVDLADLDAQMIESILDKPGEASAELSIRKPTGEIRKVMLVKEKIENDENIVSGFVLKGKASKRSIGYISLPGFFTDDAHPELKGCAVAVTKEIIKLKGESIEGLILDLRYNGGGSLHEAIELAGLFIDVGPVGVLETRGEPPVVLKDMNRGMIYDGPLVIMVNGASASASEVVSAALQDYKRAIIAGTTTYGKATGQGIVALDNAHPDEGFLKITEIRLYRINGKTHQMNGISPDFPIHDLSSVVYRREESSPHVLKPGTTNKKTYYTPWPKTFGDEIKSTLNSNPKVSNYESVAALEKIFSAKIPLERQAFIAFMKDLDAASKRASEGVGDRGLYTVSNSKFDATVLKLDSYHAEMNKEILNQVRSSVYIQETYRLLDNIITGKK